MKEATEEDLLPAIEALAMCAQRDPSLPAAAPLASNLSFLAIQQRIILEVDEEGTELAVVVEIPAFLRRIGGGPRPITIRIDKPFLFAIRDTETGLLLVMGYIARPVVSRRSARWKFLDRLRGQFSAVGRSGSGRSRR